LRRELDAGERKIARHELPERAQTVDPRVGGVAGDDGGIDGADRDAGDPVGGDVRLGQCLVHAGLVGAERAAALQDERRPLER
jgi:hypothetical protein